MDLGIFTNTALVGDVKLGLELGPGCGVVGIEKAAQAFTTFFLTQRGTNTYDPTFGSPFIGDMLTGGIRTDRDIQAAFGLAVSLFLQYNTLHTVVSTPADEQITSVTLISSSIDAVAEKLTLYVQIATAAGSSRQITLPIPMVAV
ncbi:MAG: hypothetical protein D0530_04800 [Methylococcales bacterium]|nr:MAG: hypothetical protein D0530_04800 [Methylococcales bacterium]